MEVYEETEPSDRRQLEELLERAVREPASRWGFRSENEKIVWLLSKLARGLTSRAEASLREARDKARKRKKSRENASKAGQGTG